ncbi:hypothetical protein HPB50_028896 [Hyalomma asiaticum]|nr:hypothetical protein HPB50_028896 [Hyalomma asiaticum]
MNQACHLKFLAQYTLMKLLKLFEVTLECNTIWIEEFKFEVLEYILRPDLQRRLRFNWYSPTTYVDMREAVLNHFGASYRPRPPTPTHSTSTFQLFSTTPTSFSTQSTSHASDSLPTIITQACTESASTNKSGRRNIPSTNSEDPIRTASDERVFDVSRLHPPGYSPTTTQADGQHNAPTETNALIGGGCTTTGPAVCDGHLETIRGEGAASVSWLPAAWSSTPPDNRCFFK